VGSGRSVSSTIFNLGSWGAVLDYPARYRYGGLQDSRTVPDRVERTDFPPPSLVHTAQCYAGISVPSGAVTSTSLLALAVNTPSQPSLPDRGK
jgi:hypothetical protein